MGNISGKMPELVPDTYTSIKAQSEGLYKDRGSRFLAIAAPVESADEAREIILSLKKEHHDARHHCFAWRIGCRGEEFRASDDGEPSGSAGRQILGQIDSAGLSDILVVVVRWFGGIKLGVPGLIKAYKTSAADAIANAEVVEKVAGKWIRLGFGYASMPAVMSLIKSMSLPMRAQSYEENCSVEVRVRLSLEEEFLKSAGNIAGLSWETVNTQ